MSTDINLITYNVTEAGKVECIIDLTDDLALGKSGLDYLIQKVVMWLMMRPGSDGLYPDRGGGLLKLVQPGQMAASDDEIRVGLAQAVKATESQIKTSQIGKKLPKNETLKRLELAKNGIIILEGGSYIINIEIAAASGDTMLIGVPLVPESELED